MDTTPSSDGPLDDQHGLDDQHQLDEKYRLGDELGRGGVGKVHLAVDRVLGREVAVKFLHDQFSADSVVRQRFVEEAQIGGQLQHPGIVPVYDLCTEGERPFFTMKLVEGETLATLLSRRADPSSDRRRFLAAFEDICQTIAFAHARGVVHRDLKPDNVMIGAFGEVQVVDWGFGKLVAAEEPSNATAGRTPIRTVRSEGSGAESVIGSAIGTPAYMPPEQAVGDVEHTDERSDVFSLGAILCEILTGLPPYAGNDVVVQAAMARLDDARERLAECGADPELVTLTNESLQKDPMQRPSDARELARRVHDHLAAAEARVHESRVAEARAQVQARSARRILTLSLVLIAVFAGGLGTSVWFWQQAESAAERERVAKQDVSRELERSDEIRSLIQAMLEGVTPAHARRADTKLLEDILARSAEHVGDGRVTDPLVLSELDHLIGGVYLALGKLTTAQVHIDRAVAARRTALGDEHRQTLDARLRQSELLSRMSDPEAGPIVREIAATFERVSGADHPDTLTARLHEAIVIEASGEAVEAEQQLADLQQPIEAAFGKESEQWIVARSALATIYAMSGRSEQGAELVEEALVAMTTRHGETHPDVTALRVNLGVMRSSLGQHDQAIALLERAVEIEAAVLGREHPSYIRTLGALTRAFEDAGRFEAALAKVDQVLAVAPALFDAGSLEPLDSMHDRMLILRDLGRFDEAAVQGEELLRERTARLGANHEDTLGAGTDLGTVYLAQGERDRGIELLEKNLAEKLEALGPSHPYSSVCVEVLAEAYVEVGRREDAIRLVADFRQRMLADPDAPSEVLIAAVEAILAGDPNPDDLERAAGLARRAVTQRSVASGAPQGWLALEALSRVHERRGDRDAAIEALRQAVAGLPESAERDVWARRLDALRERR